MRLTRAQLVAYRELIQQRSDSDPVMKGIADEVALSWNPTQAQLVRLRDLALNASGTTPTATRERALRALFMALFTESR